MFVHQYCLLLLASKPNHAYCKSPRTNFRDTLSAGITHAYAHCSPDKVCAIISPLSFAHDSLHLHRLLSRLLLLTRGLPSESESDDIRDCLLRCGARVGIASFPPPKSSFGNEERDESNCRKFWNVSIQCKQVPKKSSPAPTCQKYLHPTFPARPLLAIPDH